MGRKATGRTTKVIPIRVSLELYNRLDELARKGLTNKNHWIVRLLNREAFKHQREQAKEAERLDELKKHPIVFKGNK